MGGSIRLAWTTSQERRGISSLYRRSKIVTEELITETYGNESLREAFGAALVEAGVKWPDLRVLDAGTKNSTYSIKFQEAYPDRFYSPGINEPGLVGLATGIAMACNRVVACDMSVFLHHAYAHIRAAARQGKGLHMVIAASHTGTATGPDGASAHDITDLTRMRLIPDVTIATPWDGAQVRSALNAILDEPGYYYLRLNRPKVPLFLPEPAPFEVGKAYRLAEGERITIIALGDKVFTALQVAEQLGEGVADVIGLATLEPIDSDTIIESAIRTCKVVTMEDHMFIGGLFESVAGILAQNHPTPIRRVALERKFTTSGQPDELAQLYGVDAESVLSVCREFIG